MNTRRSVSLSRCALSATRIFAAFLVMLGCAVSVRAQSSPRPFFVNAGALTMSDGRLAFGTVAASGETVVVAGEDEAVHVFERNPADDRWVESATLAPGDGTSRFGRSIAIAGDTIVVGADRSAYIYKRTPAGGWQEVTKLTADTNAFSFGTSVGVSGGTIVVGAPIAAPVAADLRGAPGVVYVFERDATSSHAWSEVGRLSGPSPPSNFLDLFGITVSVDADTIVAGAQVPAIPASQAHVFVRDHSGSNEWRRVAALPLTEPGATIADIPNVSVSGDTAAVGSPFSPAVARIFQRDNGGPNGWGLAHTIAPLPALHVALASDLLLVGRIGTLDAPFGGQIFARNQDRNSGWGEVARTPILVLGAVDLAFPQAAAISGDTMFVGAAAFSLPSRPRTPIVIYVADTDRDGVRDGADLCPRDPLNNIAGACTRSAAAYALLDDRLALDDLVTETHGDELHVIATFTNASAGDIGNPFFAVTALTGGNLLLNADGGAGHVGATLSPNVGDGVLQAGESMRVRFVIELQTRDAFVFNVAFRGETAQ